MSVVFERDNEFDCQLFSQRGSTSNRLGRSASRFKGLKPDQCVASYISGFAILLLLLLPLLRSPAISLGFTILLLLRCQPYLWGSLF